MALQFEAFRRGVLERVNERYDAYLAQGFATADFDGQPEPETLQCRNELDRTNWIGLVLKCEAVQAAATANDTPELMGQPIDPPLRCTSNRMYAVSYADALTRMFALLDVVAKAQANWWGLKDQVRDAPTRQALFDIELDAGWP